jgi:hypothetical protein
MARAILAGLAAAVVSCVGLAAAAEQCTEDDVLARSQQVQDTCCTASTDCSNGWPTVCSATCASLYLAFFEECHAVIRSIAGGHDGLAVFDTVRDLCIEGREQPYSICSSRVSVSS